jgi:hypothetical protein
MNKFNIGDRVRAVKDSDAMKSNWIGKVEAINQNGTQLKVKFDAYYLATPDEIELIEAEPTEQDKEWLSSRPTIADKHTPKPFPTFEEFDEWFYLRWDSEMKTLYNYFAQFKYEKTVEVPLELGNMYEFSSDKENWERRMLHGYSAIMGGETKYYPCIRPIQPSRLEQLKAKHPNLSNDELIELLDILLTQMRE